MAQVLHFYLAGFFVEKMSILSYYPRGMSHCGPQRIASEGQALQLTFVLLNMDPGDRAVSVAVYLHVKV